MKFEIRNRWSAALMFECEADTFRAAVELAVEKKIDLSDSDLSDSDLSGSNLSGSNLRGSNLSGSNLRGSNLSGSNLRGSNLSDSNLSGSNLSGSNLSGSDLSGSNLSGSNLSGSNLRGSNLSGSNLSGSNLRGSNLSDSNLSGSNLSGSNLSGSNLSGSNLRGSNLSEIKKDLFYRLSMAKGEAVGLYKAHLDGRVDGSIYDGECGCFIGTLANVRGVNTDEFCKLVGLHKDSSSPTEKWYLGISKGHGEGQPIVDITLEWIREWASQNDVRLPVRKVVWE